MTGRVRQSTGAGRVRGALVLPARSIKEERVQTTDGTRLAWTTANFHETRKELIVCGKMWEDGQHLMTGLRPLIDNVF
jgi:hypothetical protein